MAPDVEWTIHSDEHQQSIKHLWSGKYGDAIVIWSLLCITDILAAFIGRGDSNTVTTSFQE